MSASKFLLFLSFLTRASKIYLPPRRYFIRFCYIVSVKVGLFLGFVRLLFFYYSFFSFISLVYLFLVVEIFKITTKYKVGGESFNLSHGQDCYFYFSFDFVVGLRQRFLGENWGKRLYAYIVDEDGIK